MIPLVTSLLQGGFTLLGNAILSKGKDVIEEKLGVNIDSMLGTEEGRIRLKQLEASNEELLRQFTLAQREQELRADQIYLGDMQDARKMQMSALGQTDEFSKRFIYYFAMAWSFVTAVYIGFITFWEIPVGNVRFADTILGFLLGTILATMFNFFYGTSKSSAAKDDVIKGVVERSK